MEIQCDCGKFKAELTGFPGNTPGRLGCYCDDCQTYLNFLGRQELLDDGGCTEIVPIYPSEIKFVTGKENLRCVRLSPKGMFRWYTTCCNSPIGNTRPKFPWVGFINRTFNVNDSKFLEKNLGPVKSRIKGKFGRGNVIPGTPDNLDFKGFVTVMPFLLKGFIFGRIKNSPFFQADGVTPISTPKILTLDERNSIRKKLGFIS